MYGPTAVGVALLEDMSHWGQALEFQKSKPGLAISLPAAYGSNREFSATFPEACLPACYYTPRKYLNGLNL